MTGLLIYAGAVALFYVLLVWGAEADPADAAELERHRRQERWYRGLDPAVDPEEDPRR